MIGKAHSDACRLEAIVPPARRRPIDARYEAALAAALESNDSADDASKRSPSTEACSYETSAW